MAIESMETAPDPRQPCVFAVVMDANILGAQRVSRSRANVVTEDFRRDGGMGSRSGPFQVMDRRNDDLVGDTSQSLLQSPEGLEDADEWARQQVEAIEDGGQEDQDDDQPGDPLSVLPLRGP